METAMPSDLDLLCHRMDQLQRENRSLKRIGLIVLVLIGAGFLMGQSGSTRTVEAESFVLKGSDGSIRAKMDTKDGSTELLLYNASGQPRVTIKVDEGGETLDMNNDSGEPVAMIDVALQKTLKVSPTTSTIAVLGSLGGPGVVMNATKEIALVRIDDQGGHRMWAASSKP
jgi:hypothetical protein